MSVDWTKHYAKYKGCWLALADDEKTVIAFGKSAKIVLEKAKQKGVEKPILTRMPTKLVTYVGRG